MLVSGGYPGSYQKGKAISGLSIEGESCTVFHAGTKAQEGKVLSNGGRVLGVNGRGDSMAEALANAYDALSSISFEGMNYRPDIGKDLEAYIQNN
jgi:phosphoribosylamine--glycine ligase